MRAVALLVLLVACRAPAPRSFPNSEGRFQIERIEGASVLVSIELPPEVVTSVRVAWAIDLRGEPRRLGALVDGRLSAELEQAPVLIRITRESTPFPEIPSEFVLAEGQIME